MTKAFLRRWHRRLLLGLLGLTLLLVLSLAYQISKKEKITSQQTLAITGDAQFSVMRNNYSILAAMVRQDYHTYTALQESIGEDGSITDLVYASNISYETRIIDSLKRLQKQLDMGNGMIGVLYATEDGDQLEHWFQEEFPYKDSATSLAKDMHRLSLEKGDDTSNTTEEPDVENLSDLLSADIPVGTESPPQMRLLDILGRSTMVFEIPLLDRSSVICFLDPEKEFGNPSFHLKVTDEYGTNLQYNEANAGELLHTRELYGLSLVFSSDNKGERFLFIILPTTLLILILILYQSHVAIQEGHTHELTGLPNMRSFDKHYQQSLRRPGITFLFFLDLRSLKLLNSIFMEEQADEVIKTFAKTLRNTLDRNDPIIHRSGDEILILLTLQDEELLPGILGRIKRVFATKTVRLRVQQNKDRAGKRFTLHKIPLKVGSFVDLPISFRIGGIALDYDAQQMPRKQLLDQVNLLAEQAKQMEKPEKPGVVWLVKYRQNGETITIKSEEEVDPGPRLVNLDKQQKQA